ncbi:hypothetical protein JXB12_00925 [candidate division KSB1 bacterium]|nr:hypothetical protein [candidate division KSB1 bacterium]
MIVKNKRLIVLVVLFIAILLTISNVLLFGRYQYDYFNDDPARPPADTQSTYDEESQSFESENFLQMPPYVWPRTTIFGVTSAVVVYVALVFGLAMFVIGYNAGAKVNKGPVTTAIILTTIVAVLARSFILWVQYHLFKILYGFFNNAATAASVAEAVIYFIWILFITGISVNLYEAFTVTAKEAHPMS